MKLESENVVKQELRVLRTIEPSILRDFVAGDLGAVYVTLDRMSEINIAKTYQIKLFKVNGKRIYPLTKPTEIDSPYTLELKDKLMLDNIVLGFLEVSLDWQRRHDQIQEQLRRIEIMAFSLFFLAMLIFLFFQRLFITRPLAEVKLASLKLAQGHFDVVLPKMEKDEIGELVKTFDFMRKNILQANQSLLAKVAEADSANQAKSEFLSRMSHELRTPMNAILGFAQILELDADNFNDIQKMNIQEILNAGKHLLSLINDVLDLSKVESGKVDMIMQPVSVSELLSECISLVRVQANESRLSIVDNISANNYWVMADEMRLKQILLNLLSNAVKYNSSDGHIILNGDIIDKQYLRISIIDSGNGIDQQEIHNLFHPFMRLNTHNNIEGAGIGLVISKHLVELMDGTIGVESTLGSGSTFWLELNLAKSS